MGKPVISNIRPGDPDGNVWDLNTLPFDDFYALNDDTAPDATTSTFDDLIAMLNLEGTGLTATDLDAYSYVFLGTNKSDTITGVTALEGDNTGVIASGNGSDDVTAGAGDHVVFAGSGTDSVSGGGGNDIIFGENGKDELAGNGGDDEIHGGKGKDTLTGGLGDDTLEGSNGVDVLDGGEGADELTGNNGDDEFHWNTTADFGDIVADFTAGSDKLVFDVGAEDPEISVGNDDLVVDGFVAGDDTAINVADTEIAVKTDEAVLTADIQTTIDGYDAITTSALFAFIEDDGTETHAVLYYDADPSTDGDAVLVAEFTNITTLEQLGALSASDFVFV